MIHVIDPNSDELSSVLKVFVERFSRQKKNNKILTLVSHHQIKRKHCQLGRKKLFKLGILV